MSSHLWLGNTCRIQPNEIVFNSPSAFRSIYGNKGNVRKGDTYKVWQRDMNLTSTLTETNQTVHARKKRLLAFAFTDKALHTAETFIIQHVDRWCDLLAKIDEGGNTQNLADLANYLVFDIMCDLAFGKSFDTKELGEENQLKRMPRIFDNYTSFMYKVSRFFCHCHR
jgi:cytochrome P450